jgi:hypothetical protein
MLSPTRKAAVEDHDRLIIQSGPNLDPNSRLQNLTEKSKKTEIFSALFEGAVLGSLEVCRVEKGQIDLNVTDNLSILINLEPIENGSIENDSKSGSINTDRIKTEKKNEMVQGNENMSNHHQMSISELENNQNTITEGEKMIVDTDSGDSIDDRKWLADLFSSSLLKAQLLLLEHWTACLAVEREKKKTEREAAAAVAIAIAASSALNYNKFKSTGPINTISLTTTNNNKPNPKESTVQDPKEHSSESCSASLLGVDVSKRLVDSVLRSRVRDVGDGIALTINRSLGETSLSAIPFLFSFLFFLSNSTLYLLIYLFYLSSCYFIFLFSFLLVSFLDWYFIAHFYCICLSLLHLQFLHFVLTLFFSYICVIYVYLSLRIIMPLDRICAEYSRSDIL